MTRYSRIARTVFGVPWAVTRPTMDAIVEVMERRIAGGTLAEHEIAERLAAAREAAGPRTGTGGAGSIAVIPIYGVLSHRINLMTEMSGGTSVQQLTGAFRQALADPTVTGIIFDVDSPGGSMSGIPELAAEIRAARGQKPMVAVANTLCASAAYWLAAQADEIIATPSALVGSVGVVMVHEDYSAANEQAGVTVTYITAGDYKAEGNPDQPLSNDAETYMQSLVDDACAMFVNDVAKGRGTNAKDVRDNYGQGRVLTPANAQKAGMVDRIDTFDGAVGRVARGRVGRSAETPYTLIDKGAVVNPAVMVTTSWTAAAGSQQADDDGPRDPDDPTDEGPSPADQAQVVALAKARARRRRAIPA